MQAINIDVSEIDKITEMHCKWIKTMNWDNGSELKKLGLVMSEIGEAIDECRGTEIPKDYYYEVSDVVLRIVALIKQIDSKLVPSELIATKLKYIKPEDIYLDLNLDHLEYMAAISIRIAAAINACLIMKDRMTIIDQLVTCLIACYAHVEKDGVYFEGIIVEKIEKNLERGSKGRVV